MDKTGVLIVDDSAFMRKVLSDILTETDDFSVVDTARDGNDALAKIERYGGEVQLVTLDIQMPGMDGLQCLKEIMTRHPRRVIMVSSLTTEGAAETLEALETGAVDFFAKPGGAISLEFREVAPRFLDVLRGAVKTRLGQPRRPAAPIHAAAVRPSAATEKPGSTARKVVAIASSTGGPRALGQVIPLLPRNLGAAVVVVQHMPATFTKLLADRLSAAGGMQVKEAEEGEELRAGMAYMAPGGMHLEITPQYTAHLTKDPPIGGLRPCADVTFRTIARAYGRQVLGVVLTGMGKDGTEGCREFKKSGCTILAENKTTAMIYGMPKAVAEAGLVNRQLPLQEIAQAIVDEVARL